MDGPVDRGSSTSCPTGPDQANVVNHARTLIVHRWIWDLSVGRAMAGSRWRVTGGGHCVDHRFRAHILPYT